MKDKLYVAPKCDKDTLEHLYLLDKHVKHFKSYLMCGDKKNADFLIATIIALIKYQLIHDIERLEK